MEPPDPSRSLNPSPDPKPKPKPKPNPNPKRRPPLQAALSLSCVGLLTRRRALPRLLCALALLLLGVDLFLRLNAGVTRSRSLSPEP